MSVKRTPPEPPQWIKTAIRPRSIGHALLTFARFKRGKPFNAKDVLYVLSGRFENNYAVTRCAKGLVREGLIDLVGEEKWVITEKGRILLLQFTEFEKLTPFSKKFPGTKKDPILDSVD